MAEKMNSVVPSVADFPNGAAFTDGSKTDVSDKQTLLAVLQFLKKNNLKGTEELLKREAGINDADVKPEVTTQSESEVSHALAAYKSDDDPSLYDDYYTNFKDFIESCLDVHKVELAMILYPVFVHMYLELVYNGHEQHAQIFFRKYSLDQEAYYLEDLHKLSTVTKQEHMKGNQLMENFKSSKFVLKMSRDSYTHLKRFLQDKKMNLLLNIIQEHLFIDVFDGIPRTKQQIDTSCGGTLGEAAREAALKRQTKILKAFMRSDVDFALKQGSLTQSQDVSQTPAQDALPTEGQEGSPSADQDTSPTAGQDSSPTAGQQQVKIHHQQQVSSSAGQDMLPSASQDTSPTAGQEVSPSAGQYMFPSAGQEVSPSAGQEVWPTAGQDTLQTTGQNMLPSAGQYRSGEIDAVSCNVIRSFISNAEVRAAVGINKNNTYLFASTDILTTGPVQTYDEAEHRAGEKAENETEREAHHAPDEEYTSMGDDNYMEMLEEDGSGDDEEEYDGKRKRK